MFSQPTFRALICGFVISGMTAVVMFLGSAGGRHLDPALAGYQLGIILASYLVGYRTGLWIQRPATALFFREGILCLLKTAWIRDPIRSRKNTISSRSVNWKNPLFLFREFTSKFAEQRFIRKRSLYRWTMHLCLSGGCTLAFAITFPLVFGWVHFESMPEFAEVYEVIVFGIHADRFHIESVKGFLVLNALNISAGVVLVGLIMAFLRRIFDNGVRAVQTFYEDILPLILILLVTLTGLMLTVSYDFLDGRGHSGIAKIHMLTVVALFFYIPYGKLFHIFQRGLVMSVSIFKARGSEGVQSYCLRCSTPFASKLHIEGLKSVLENLGFDYTYRSDNRSVHYQDVCPPCRRKLLGVNQGISLNR